MNDFVEQVIKDTMEGYKPENAYMKGILKGLQVALDIIEADKRINGRVIINEEKEEVA